MYKTHILNSSITNNNWYFYLYFILQPASPLIPNAVGTYEFEQSQAKTPTIKVLIEKLYILVRAGGRGYQHRGIWWSHATGTGSALSQPLTTERQFNFCSCGQIVTFLFFIYLTAHETQACALKTLAFAERHCLRKRPGWLWLLLHFITKEKLHL